MPLCFVPSWVSLRQVGGASSGFPLCFSALFTERVLSFSIQLNEQRFATGVRRRIEDA